MNGKTVTSYTYSLCEDKGDRIMVEHKWERESIGRYFGRCNWYRFWAWKSNSLFHCRFYSEY